MAPKAKCAGGVAAARQPPGDAAPKAEPAASGGGKGKGKKKK